MTPATIPPAVIWSYLGFGAVIAAGLAAGARRGDWRARGWERLVSLGPLFYAAPLAGFGLEHFTQTPAIASLIPRWMPWPLFWTYAIGAGFVIGGFSLVTRVLARLSAPIVAVTFFCFVVLMDVPAWARAPGDRLGMVLALRELAFGAGALAFAATILRGAFPRGSGAAAAVARGCLAATTVCYGIEQSLYGANVPGIPLRPLTPAYIPGHAIWTSLAACAYAVTGLLLMANRRTRAAATALGAAVIVIVLAVYVPMAVVERASLAGFNFLADTLMFGGAALLVAGAMPQETRR